MSDGTFYSFHASVGSAIATELGITTNGGGVAIFMYRGNSWRGFALAVPISSFGDLKIGRIYNENTLMWKEYAAKNDLPIKETGYYHFEGIAAGESVLTPIVYTKSYTGNPYVILVNASGNGFAVLAAGARTSTGFNLQAYNPTSGSINVDARWFTIEL